MAQGMTYDELLKKARRELPAQTKKDIRFEVPKVMGMLQGNKTVINNLKEIANYLSRPPEHLIKFLLRELATSGEIKGKITIFIGKFGSKTLNEKVQKYMTEFVTCRECKKPDTKITKQDRVTLLKCMACGASYPIRTIK